MEFGCFGTDSADLELKTKEDHMCATCAPCRSHFPTRKSNRRIEAFENHMRAEHLPLVRRTTTFPYTAHSPINLFKPYKYRRCVPRICTCAPCIFRFYKYTGFRQKFGVQALET